MPTSLVVKNGSKIVSSSSGAMPAAGIRHGDGDEVAAAGGLRAEGRDAAHLAHADGELAFAFHGVAAVDGEVDQGGFELGDVGNRKAMAVRYLDVDPDPAADEGTDELRHGLDLRADIEHLRLQRLPAGKCQQLSGQLGSALHGLGNRVDVAPAALLPAARGGAGSRSRSG